MRVHPTKAARVGPARQLTMPLGPDPLGAMSPAERATAVERLATLLAPGRGRTVMASADVLPPAVLRRKAVVYVRQSSPGQVQANLESKRRQYELAEVARRRGFRHVEVIDDELGRSAGGAVERPGFERLVAWLCAGQVGAVPCLEASRLARNGRDWHHLLDLCGLAGARVIDTDGVHDPGRPNDRLLLGMKGSISEFELGILRTRMLDAARDKARRGELRIPVPVGYTWHREVGLGLDPDIRVQEAVRLVVSRFRELGSARQVLLALTAEGMCFPRPSDGKRLVSLDWAPIRYRNVISVLKNPFYAGAYAYGKSENRTAIVGGRARKSYGHGRPREEWEVLIRDHHPAYLGWAELERNQTQLAANAHGRAGGEKSGRGGRALLVGLLSCAGCGRRLAVSYRGRGVGQHAYRCDRPNQMLALPRCLGFGGPKIDAAVAEEAMVVLQPLAVEAALEAERRHMDAQGEQRRMAELDLRQARYEASLAERRYAACDPENRLIAAQLEAAWEAALRRAAACEGRLGAAPQTRAEGAELDFAGLADDLRAAWNAPGVTTRARQRLLRALVADIVADVDEAAREVVLTIHWRGGRHSSLRLPKLRSEEHGCRTPEEALAVIRIMATRWSDADIAASLNRMGMRTGQGKTWTAHRLGSLRRVHGIHAYRSAEKGGEWLTLSAAAAALGVSHYRVRRLIQAGILAADQVMPDAPYQIRAVDLRDEAVVKAASARKSPCNACPEDQLSMFPGT